MKNHTRITFFLGLIPSKCGFIIIKLWRNFMGVNFSKIITVLIFSSLFFLNSCKTDTSGTPDDSGKLQVYNEDGTPFNGTIELVGLPRARLDSGYYPWKLYGRIVSGKMEIDFPDVELGLGSSQYCRVYIETKNSSSTQFGLYKPGSYDDRVYIYYSTGNFTEYNPYEPENGIALKPGWNFVEELHNPNWSYDSGEPYWITGLISKNVNYFYNKGYRWQLERWI
jgi:hypothetical protein